MHSSKQVRSSTLGECLPASCDSDAVAAFLAAAGRRATKLAVAAGISADIHTYNIRQVPGPYDLYADGRFYALA